MNAPFTARTRHRVVTAILALAAAGLLAACGTASSGSAAGVASSAAHSALANPTISSDLNQAEQLLVTNVQKNFQPAHPVKSMEAAIRATFPKGDVKAIAGYALRVFSPAVLTTSGPGSARDAWAEHVFNFAEEQGGYTPPPSGSPSPAVTASPAGSTV